MMKMRSFTFISALSVLAILGTVAGRRRCNLVCRIREIFMCDPSCDSGHPPTKTPRLCDRCASDGKCSRGLCCGAPKGSVGGGTCVPIWYAGPHCELEKDDCICQFCGGIAGIPCDEGFYCKLSGNYPDAGGVCLPKKEPPPKKELEICDRCGHGCEGQCSRGLCCGAPKNSGGGGICVPIWYAGHNCELKKNDGICKSCGGKNCPLCDKGLVCEFDGDCPDAEGVCLPEDGPPPKDGLEVCDQCRYGSVGECSPSLCCGAPKNNNGRGICVPFWYAGHNCELKKNDGICKSCGGKNCPLCDKGLKCVYDGDCPDAEGVCLPEDGPPPKDGLEVCDQCRYGSVGECSPGLCCGAPKDNNGRGICVPVWYAGHNCVLKKNDNICKSCGPHHIGILCNDGLECVKDDDCPDADGVCLPKDGPDCPPGEGDICESCGGFIGKGCKYGLKCVFKPGQGDLGTCLPIDGSGHDTCGQPGGVCERCNKDSDCQDSLYCDKYRGKCVPKTGSWKCDPKKGEEYSDCGNSCLESCDTYVHHKICPYVCIAGCWCPNDKRRNKQGRCVNPEECFWE